MTDTKRQSGKQEICDVCEQRISLVMDCHDQLCPIRQPHPTEPDRPEGDMQQRIDECRYACKNGLVYDVNFYAKPCPIHGGKRD